MASALRNVRWIGSRPSRSKAIPPEIWAKYKGELYLAYQVLTLEEVMEHMSTTYDFKPSRRQYVAQFDKWNFRKYRTARNCVPPDDWRGKQIISEHLTADTLLKRKAPTTADSSSSQAPSAKRQRFSTSMGMNKDATDSSYSSSSCDVVDTQEQDIEEGNTFLTGAAAFNAVMEDNTFFQRPASSLETTIDVSRDMSTFSRRDLQTTKLAADFLSSIGLRAQAFLLYVTLLKRLQTIPNCPDDVMIRAIIDCSRNAMKSNQIQIADALLERRLGSGGDSPEAFVWRGLRADLSHRANGGNGGVSLESTLRDVDMDRGLFLISLPAEHRALDFLGYRF
ncbi:hypothetical protein NA57DRAFT_74229 [Rhizodiscina lignyota]|uniref:Clr5 domain-containing protein n=1 Tax=Rhizodiscina lignyota TaxID=1504668 RepID=A0A9P4IJ85_9PEZI|nr:hypothetical protein NA57DRAFT_74229 [Rhizodiscina lignyota]